MYARTYITTLGRAQASRAQANLRLRRPRLRGLGDPTSDWWAAYDLRGQLYAQAAALLAQGTPLQAQLTTIYNQMMATPGYNGNPGRTPQSDAQYSALSAQYGPLQAQIASLTSQRNAVLQQYSSTDWILTTPAPGPRPTTTTPTSSTPTTSSTPVSTVSTSPAATSTTTATVPATSSGDWLSDLLTPSISIPILGNVPTVYAIGGAALLAWIAIESFSHKRR